MSYAPNYDPSNSFADDELNQASGRSTVRTVEVDTQLANISASINALNDNLKALQRDDDKLRDWLIEPRTLSEQTRAMLAAAGKVIRGEWAINTDYASGDLVQRNAVAYLCQTAHNSGPTFNLGFWIAISGDGQAQAFAEEAEASKLAAEAAEGQAATAANTALAAATAADASKVAAASSQLAAQNAADSVAALAPVNLSAYMLDLLANNTASGARSDLGVSPTADVTLKADAANTTDPAKGDALLGVKRTDIAGVVTNLHLWMNAQVFNVKSDGGAAGDGTVCTAAIQDIADKIAAFQTLQITAHQLTKSVMYFPDGCYHVNDAIKVRGFISILGTGTAYTGGSVIRQVVAGKNIFEFYGSVNDRRSLGVTVEGMNFEFDETLGTSTGWALFFPKNDDVVPANVLSSNSHYIRRNRFGGWHRQGRFLRMVNCNDVEISSNIIDVCPAAAIELGDSASATSRVTDCRIFGNGFYNCTKGVALRNVAAVSIYGNAFFDQFAADWCGIEMLSTGAIVAGRIEGVTITGNTFARCYTAYRVDGSCTGVNIGANVHSRCLDYPLRTEGATDVQGLTWHDETLRLASTAASPADAASYARSALILSSGCDIKNSSITSINVDANGITSLVGLGVERSGNSPFKAGMVIRDINITNGAANAGNYLLLPATASGLEVRGSQVFAAYPTAAPVFNLNTFAIQDSMTFDLDYEVEINKSGGNISTRVGCVRISAVRIRNVGTLASDVTVISSVADDYNGTGGTSLPTVTFAVTTGSPATVTITVSAAGIVAPVVVTVRCRAHSFRATANAQIKAA